MNFEIGTGLKRLSTPDVKTTRPSEWEVICSAAFSGEAQAKRNSFDLFPPKIKQFRYFRFISCCAQVFFPHHKSLAFPSRDCASDRTQNPSLISVVLFTLMKIIIVKWNVWRGRPERTQKTRSDRGQISHTTLHKSDPHFIDLSCRTGEKTIKVVCAMCMWRICVAFQTSRMEGKQEAKERRKLLWEISSSIKNKGKLSNTKINSTASCYVLPRARGKAVVSIFIANFPHRQPESSALRRFIAQSSGYIAHGAEMHFKAARMKNSFVKHCCERI